MLSYHNSALSQIWQIVLSPSDPGAQRDEMTCPRSQEGFVSLQNQVIEGKDSGVRHICVQIQVLTVTSYVTDLSGPGQCSPLILHPHHWRECSQLLTASTCIYVAAGACFASTPTVVQSDRELSFLGAAATKTYQSWWKIPVPSSSTWDDSEIWIQWLPKLPQQE